MTTTRTAVVTVTVTSWKEDRVVEADASHAIAHAVYATTLAGDVVGESTATLLISYLNGEAAQPETLEGPYLGYEQVKGTLDGRSGTFVLALSGTHGGGVARTDVKIVDGSGTGDLVGITGSGSYAADAMTYTMTLEYRVGE